MPLTLVLALAGLFLVLPASPAAAQTRPCDRLVSFQHAEATGPVEIVPGKPNARVYQCGIVLAQKGNTLDFKMWTAQPGSNCTGGTSDLTPQFSLPVDVVMVNRIENVGPSSEPGQSLCIQTLGSGGLTGVVYWAQF